MESPGEDAYLNGLMVAATVKGFQQDSLETDHSMVACTKHFAAYGAVEGGRDYNTVDISDRWLREYYLPGYKSALDAGSKMVMTSFNIFDGIPATVNDYLMNDILRQEWEFDHILISDWQAPFEAMVHGACEDEQDCCIKTIDAQLDIEMVSPIYFNNLESLVKDGTISETLIDKSVTRILSLKEELGLFDNPFRDLDEEKVNDIFLCDEHRALAKEAAIKSSVLLKNDGTLPFSKDVKTIAIIGPHADNQEILGWWEAMGDTNDAISLASGIKSKLGATTKIVTANGCDIRKPLSDNPDELIKAIELAESADIVILALGESQDMSGEAGNRTNIDVPGDQQILAKKILEQGKPTAMVLFSGRPLTLDWFDHHMPAILNVCSWNRRW